MSGTRITSWLGGLAAAALAAAPAMGITAYQQEVLKDNPLLYWTFDEAGGNAINLAGGGAANELAPGGGATRIDHASIASGLNLGNAASFSGANGNRFYAPNLYGAANGSVPTQLWALEFWFQAQGPNTDSRGDYLFEQIGPGSNNPGIIYDFNHGGGDTNHLEFFGGGGRTGAQGPVVNDQDWHHAVMAFLGNSGGFGIADFQVFYLDGNLVAATGNGFSAGFGLNELAVGATVAAGGVNGFEGRIDEVALYDVGSMLSNPIQFNNGDSINEFFAILQDIADHRNLATAGDAAGEVIQGVTYQYDPAGIQFFNGSGRDDNALTKLTDGVVGYSSGPLQATANINNGEYVGFAEAQFGQDTGVPHPGVIFDLGGNQAVGEIWIDYIGAGGFAGVEAPDEVDVLLSDDGVTFTLLSTFDGFNDFGDNANFFSRRLVLDIDDSLASFVKLDFHNDNQWTFLSEVTFVSGQAGVPEPASLVLLLTAAPWVLRRRRGGPLAAAAG